MSFLIFKTVSTELAKCFVRGAINISSLRDAERSRTSGRVRLERRRDGFRFKCQSNCHLRRWLGPQRKPASEHVFLDARSKVKFMVPLDLGHFQQAVDQVKATAVSRIARGGFVFSDVATLKLSRAVHRRQPARDVAQQTQSAANDRGADLAAFAGSGAKAGKHFTHEFTMAPLVLLDLPDRFSLIRLTD